MSISLLSRAVNHIHESASTRHSASLHILICVLYRPTTLEELLAIKAKHNDAKLVVGNTEVGIEMKFKVMAYPVLIGATHVPELNRLEVWPGLTSDCALAWQLQGLMLTIMHWARGHCHASLCKLFIGSFWQGLKHF